MGWDGILQRSRNPLQMTAMNMIGRQIEYRAILFALGASSSLTKILAAASGTISSTVYLQASSVRLGPKTFTTQTSENSPLSQTSLVGEMIVYSNVFDDFFYREEYLQDWKRFWVYKGSFLLLGY